MYIDFKITTWDRAFVPDKDVKKVLKNLQNKNIESGSDLMNYSPETTWEKLCDVEEQMSPEENGGNSTIEAFDKKDKMIFNNKIEDF